MSVRWDDVSDQMKVGAAKSLTPNNKYLSEVNGFCAFLYDESALSYGVIKLKLNIK